MPNRWTSIALLLVLAALVAWLWTGGGRRDGDAPAADIRSDAADPAAASGGMDAAPASSRPSPVATERTEVAAGPGLLGRLVQAGRPLAGAALRASTDDWRDREIGRALAGPDGTFALPLAAGRYRLTITGNTVPPRCLLQPIGLVPGERRDLGDVDVPLAASVRGRVVDESGAPMPATRVACVCAGDNERQRYEILDPASPQASPSAVSDADGRFVIGGMMPGTGSLDSRHPDCWGSATVELRAGECVDAGDLVLQRFASVRGFVFDQDGAPVEGATIMPGGSDYNCTVAWRSVRTAADGGFLLRGCGSGEIGVVKAGFEPLHCEQLGSERPLRLVLHAAAPLAGIVVGANGCAGSVRVEMIEYRDQPWWVDRVLYTPQPIAADGSFRIAGLPAGLWLVSARIEGLGSVPPQTVQVPLAEPLRLQLVPDQQVAVTVRDDLGAPVAGATLVRVELGDLPALPLADPSALGRTWCGYGGREQVTTDATGQARVRVPAHLALTLAATGPRQLFTAAAAPAGEVPASLDLVLPRGGVLFGRLADTGLLAEMHVYAACRRAGEPDKIVASFGVDRRGNFRSAPLLPGSYTVALHLNDAANAPFGMRMSTAVPLLGDYEPVTTPLAVEVEAGVDTRIELPVPHCGDVEGRVLVAGVPLASAIVFGCNPAVPGFHAAQLQFPDAHTEHPFCRTDAAGRFRFRVGCTATFELRARHPLGAAWSEPLVLPLSPQSHVQRDLRLHAAAIRGSFDVSAIAPKDRAFLTAQLYRLQDAGDDPFASGDWVLSQEWQVAKAPLGRTGSFAFECLPPGGYVLRLVRPWREIVLTRILHTTGDELLDLGALALPDTVVPQLACGLQPQYSVTLLAAAGKDAAYVRGIARDADGKLDWGAWVPGHYRLQAGLREDLYLDGFGIGAKPIGEPVDVEVHADGSCTPAVVWPDGVKG